MPSLTDPQRWMMPAVLLLSAAGAPLAVWWERRHPSVPEHVLQARARRRAAAEQELADELVRRAQTNALYHP